MSTPTIRTSYKYQHRELKKQFSKHTTTLFGHVFNQKVFETMVGKYLKSVRDNYRTNLNHRPNYEHPRLITIREWVALIEDVKENKMKKGILTT